LFGERIDQQMFLNHRKQHNQKLETKRE